VSTEMLWKIFLKKGVSVAYIWTIQDTVCGDNFECEKIR